MQNKNLVLAVFLLLTGLAMSYAQSPSSGFLSMDGLVYGYDYNPSKKILKKDKQIKIEGVLDFVTVKILEKGKVIETTTTSTNGLFSFKIKIGANYIIELSKSGYSPISLAIDLNNIPTEMVNQGLIFKGAELILNRFQPKSTDQISQPYGRLFYNNHKGEIDFEAAKFVSKNQKEYISNPVSLMLRSVEKNENSNLLITTPNPTLKALTKTEKNVAPIKTEAIIEPAPINTEIKKTNPIYDTVSNFYHVLKAKQSGKITEQDIQSLQGRISEAKKQLEKDRLNANTPEDSLLISQTEILLNSLETELESAKKQIAYQEEKISSQKKMLYLSIACVILLLGFLVFIFKYNKEKKKTYLILKDKNKKITDSINYAQRIQESVLPSEVEIRTLLPKSFIFFQPRDIVSGDFYWLSNLKNKTIIACVDCTGHGVPGAFMSLIGNTLLNEIVNEKETTDAASVLKQLNNQVLKVLHQNTENAQNKDGMEMGLCFINYSTNELEYAGAMNPMYVVKDNTITVIKPDIKGIGGDLNSNKETEFTNHVIPIQNGMSVYMFTDGYMDQFGGPENKKFNISNFKKMLLDIQSLPMNEQKKVVAETIKKWQGDRRQIDDMLVIGIAF
ncbi:MAG: SpoIIE family protein phosphatase [Bacteroidetes bacterium]|nr:SpoIIE family protein phosphatase [Bacteroidota bacterium]